jgi:hypothetical protein
MVLADSASDARCVSLRQRLFCVSLENVPHYHHCPLCNVSMIDYVLVEEKR